MMMYSYIHGIDRTFVVLSGTNPYTVHVFTTHNQAVYDFSNPTDTKENEKVQINQTKQVIIDARNEKCCKIIF